MIDLGSAALIIMLLTITASVIAFFNREFFMLCVLHPYSIGDGRRFHTLITGNVIHADFGHLAFNMFTFYFFAFSLEGIIGSENFIIIYVISMLVADAPAVVKHRSNPDYFTLGASGAVSGIVFAMILLNPQMKMSLLFLPIPIPAYIFGPLYIFYSYYASRSHNDMINHDAHLWGAFGGAVTTLIVVPDSLEIFKAGIGLTL